MTRVIAAISLLCLAALPGGSKEREVEWKPATVLHAQYRMDSSAGVAGGGGTTVARGEFEFDAGDVVYTAVEQVAPNVRMQLSQGDTVEIAVEKKTLMLKVNVDKIRKLKLTGTVVKQKR